MTSTDATDSRDAGHNPSAGGGGHFVRWAILGFVVACVGLFVLATQIETETAAPGFPLTPVAVPAADGTFRLTLDTANRNAWVGVDLGGGRAVAGQAPADLRLRRYLLQAPGGVVDLGPISLSEATPPSADAEWVMDVDVDGASQSLAAAQQMNDTTNYVVEPLGLGKE